jgi:protein gp37
MGAESKIEWTDATWPVVKGCDYVSPGCANCYAADLIHRHSFNPNKKISLPVAGLTEVRGGRPRWTGKVYLNEPHLADPLTWTRPRMIFVPSHGDLFHEDVPDEFLLAVFDVMRRCTWAGGQNCGRIGGGGHTFQVLTKRPERMRDFVTRLRWDGERLHLAEPGSPFPPGSLASVLEQIWLGVSVEDQQRADERIPVLLQTPAAVRFLSVEPLLGPVDLTPWLYSDKVGWVIVGGESGPGARPCHLEWVRSIVRQCKAASVPVFVKQLGSRPEGYVWVPSAERPGDGTDSCVSLRVFDRKGGLPHEWPADIRVREFPGGADRPHPGRA